MTKLNKRDSIIICTVALLILFGLLFNAFYHPETQPETLPDGYYALTLEVEAIDPFDDLWLTKDSIYYWNIDGKDAEDIFQGDYLSCVMHDNGTPNYIGDDIIVKWQYSGFYDPKNQYIPDIVIYGTDPV